MEHIGLCNIVAGKTVARELIQDDASPEQIAAEVGRLLGDVSYASEIKTQLASVREQLGGGGADQRMAELVRTMVKHP